MDQYQEAENSFDTLGLDARLVRALEKLKYANPTPVQVECIKAALSGKDIVARAQTGSGKTLAYLLPALQRILSQPPEVARSSWQCLILVPTRELAEQVAGQARALAGHCGAMISVSALTAEAEAAQHSQLLQAGHLVVATPGRIAQAFAEGRLRQAVFQPDGRQRRAGLSTLVLDEADLMLSMPGYDADFAALAPLVPRSCQCMLMSATTSAQVEKLQKLLLHNPETLNLLGASPSGEPPSTATASGSSQHISHFYLDCSREDRPLVVLVLLKLGLVNSKTLLFVNGAESGYRLRLLLEAFGIRSAVLLADLPLNSRTHILQEFNKGLFDNLIAVDDPRSQGGSGAPPPPKPERAGKSGKKRKQAELEAGADQEYGVVRGIDFKGVRTVVNVEPPDGVAGYVHRVGRTGRAGKPGTAITLLTSADHALSAALRQALLPGGGERESGGAEVGGLMAFSQLERRSLEALRYRGEDILRSLNKQVVREARAKDLRLELLNSERLAAHFEAHPGDLALLRHDKPLAKAAGGSHLKGLPGYLARAAGKATPSSLAPGGRAQMWRRNRRKLGGGGAADPLKKGAGFSKAPRRGEGASEPLTRMEIEAEKHAPKPNKAAGFLPKRNVRKGKHRKR